MNDECRYKYFTSFKQKWLESGGCRDCLGALSRNGLFTHIPKPLFIIMTRVCKKCKNGNKLWA